MTDHDAARARQAAQAWPDSALGRSVNAWPDRIVDDVPENLPELDRSWIDQAACKGMHVGVFFPERGDSLIGPESICRACPVRIDCLNYAMRRNEKYGIWGGTSENQRRRLRKSIAVGDLTLAEVLDAYSGHDEIAHGSATGYRGHLRRDIPPCDACRAAWRAYQRHHKTKEAS